MYKFASGTVEYKNTRLLTFGDTETLGNRVSVYTSGNGASFVLFTDEAGNYPEFYAKQNNLWIGPDGGLLTNVSGTLSTGGTSFTPVTDWLIQDGTTLSSGLFPQWKSLHSIDPSGPSAAGILPLSIVTIDGADASILTVLTSGTYSITYTASVFVNNSAGSSGGTSDLTVYVAFDHDSSGPGLFATQVHSFSVQAHDTQSVAVTGTVGPLVIETGHEIQLEVTSGNAFTHTIQGCVLSVTKFA